MNSLYDQSVQSIDVVVPQIDTKITIDKKNLFTYVQSQIKKVRQDIKNKVKSNIKTNQPYIQSYIQSAKSQSTVDDIKAFKVEQDLEGKDRLNIKNNSAIPVLQIKTNACIRDQERVNMLSEAVKGIKESIVEEAQKIANNKSYKFVSNPAKPGFLHSLRRAFGLSNNIDPAPATIPRLRNSIFVVDYCYKFMTNYSAEELSSNTAYDIKAKFNQALDILYRMYLVEKYQIKDANELYLRIHHIGLVDASSEKNQLKKQLLAIQYSDLSDPKNKDYMIDQVADFNKWLKSPKLLENLLKRSDNKDFSNSQELYSLTSLTSDQIKILLDSGISADLEVNVQWPFDLNFTDLEANQAVQINNENNRSNKLNINIVNSHLINTAYNPSVHSMDNINSISTNINHSEVMTKSRMRRKLGTEEQIDMQTIQNESVA